MRLSDSILIAVLIVLLLASILAPKERPEHFYGYNVLGGGNVKWEDAAECSDRAIGFQEDTTGRYWGWQDNASCAFFQFSGGRPNKAQPPPPPPPAQQPKNDQYGGISYNAQCGGTGGMCKDGTTTPCVDRPWGDPCAQGGVCERESDQLWKCKERGDKGPSIAQPTDGAGSAGAKSVRKKGQTCGGKGGECGTLNGAGCYDNAWANWTCESGSSCQRVNEWHWECK